MSNYSFVPPPQPLKPRIRDVFIGLWLASFFGSIAMVFFIWPLIGQLARGEIGATAPELAQAAIEPMVWTNFVIVLFEIFWAVRLVMVRGSGSFALDLGLRFKPIDVLWGVGGWVLIFVGGVALEKFVVPWLLPGGNEPDPYNPLEAYTEISPSLKLIMLLTIGVLVPFAEEMLFRGVMLRAFSRWVGPIGGIIFSAIIFGVLHANSVSVRSWAFVLWAIWAGIVFGFLRVGTDRLGSSIIAHGLHNSLLVILMIVAS